MKRWNSSEVREKFLNFFKRHDHLLISSSSLIPKDDPTLLFINSGMAPLKKYFLGEEIPPAIHLCNIQPCIRTKDIDDVGDRQHLTMFEMLGSWSIGGYYKEKACALAHDLLVNEFFLDPEKLYVTVYAGEKKKNLKADLESLAAWEKLGVAKDHIVMLEKDNFWEPPGNTGPCGPCTEVFFDTGPDYGPQYVPGGYFDDVNRYIEIWNAGVFMELNKTKEGLFEELPIKSVDTGSGLERLTMILNGHHSVYETDLMLPFMKLSKSLLSTGTHTSEVLESQEFQKKCRILSDHLRAVSMILSEGVSFGHEGREYIPKKLLRRCLGLLINSKVHRRNFKDFIYQTIDLFSPHYSHLTLSKEKILSAVENEIHEFDIMLEKGLPLIEREPKPLSEKSIFKLVSTHGLPLEMIEGYLKEKNIPFCLEKYKKYYRRHQATSKMTIFPGETLSQKFFAELVPTNFEGYDKYSLTSSIQLLLVDFQKVSHVRTGEEFLFVTKNTPFYATSGGQTGDTGTLINSAFEGKVLETTRWKEYFLHRAIAIKGTLREHDEIELSIEIRRRRAIARNHSATHLLHSALHRLIGEQSTQKGSHISANNLRFDFQHHTPLNALELESIESLINYWICKNIPCAIENMSYEAALARGAQALFGERYQKDVRVVTFSKYSMELCGGSHVTRTGSIGSFIIVQETSVSKGVRRIEAATGEAAIQIIQERQRVLQNIQKIFQTSLKSLPERVRSLQEQTKKRLELNTTTFDYIQKSTLSIQGLKAFVGLLNISTLRELKKIGDILIQKDDYKIICLLINDKKTISCVWVNKKIKTQVEASALLNTIMLSLDGKGGGKQHFAQGGGRRIDNVQEFFKTLETLFK